MNRFQGCTLTFETYFSIILYVANTKSKYVEQYPQIDFAYNNTFFTNCYHLQHLDVEKETEKQVIHFSCHLKRFFLQKMVRPIIPSGNGWPK